MEALFYFGTRYPILFAQDTRIRGYCNTAAVRLINLSVIKKYDFHVIKLSFT